MARNEPQEATHGGHARTGLHLGGSRRRALRHAAERLVHVARALRPGAADAVPRGVALRGPHRPGRRAGPVLHVRGRRRAGRRVPGPRRRAARDVQRLPAPRRPGGRRLRQRKAFQCPYHGWTFELDGRVRRTQGMDGTCDFEPRHDAAAAVPGRRLGADRLGRARARGVARDVARRRHAAARELPHRRDALRRRPPLGDRLQLEALRRQLHGGLPHPLHPPRPRPEPQPDGLHLPARASTRTSSTAPSRTRAAPARGSPASSAARRSCAR